MKLSDYVWDRIAETGVKHVFMLPGGGCMHLVDSLGRHPGLKFICNLHEQGAAIAADAYAQVRGFGAALVTTGPGGTNAITGVAGAWLDSTPMIVISGQVKRADMKRDLGVRQLGFQEIDIVSLVSPITKYAVTVDEPSQIRYHLERALFEAKAGRPGPVWIDIPLDVQAWDIDPEALESFVAPVLAAQEQKFHEEALVGAARRFLDALRTSERPVLFLGNGVRLSGAVPEALQFAEKTGLPVLTTWKASDFLPEDHPLFAGRPGAAGQRAANWAQQNADLALILGARLDHGQVAYWPENFAPKARKFIIDIDGAELNKLHMALDCALQADAGEFLRILLRELDRQPVHPACEASASLKLFSDAFPENNFKDWISQIRQWRDRHPVLDSKYWEEQGHVNLYVLVEALAALLEAGDVIAPGSSGQCSEVTCQAWPLKAGVRFVNSQGLGAMGFGVPGALGACIASGGHRTICLDGDGGFQMNIQELEVIHRLNLPIKLFVLDNRGYGSIRGSQRNYFQGRLVASDAASGLTLPDSLKIAEAYGIPGANLEDHADLKAKLKALLDAPGPLICRVNMNPDQPTQPRVTSYRKEDGSMASKPMEDMWPTVDPS